MEVESNAHSPVDGHEGHVHFPEDQVAEHSDIVVRAGRSGKVLEVHLGFLQIKHTYQLKFSIKDDLGEEIEVDPLQNLNVRVVEANPSKDNLGHDFVLEFSANKEKLQKEKLVVSSSTDTTKKLTLELQARVLGKGKGTPSLKSGIHVIRVDEDEESELSDWQGFS